MKVCSIAVAIALAAGCQEKASDSPPKPPVAIVPTDGLELLREGAMPRRALRYHVAKGTTTPVEMVLDVDMTAAGQGGPLPTMTMEIEIAGDDVKPDGSMSVRTTIHKVTASDRPGSTIAADKIGTQLMEGIVLRGTLAPTGTLSEMKLDTAGAELPPGITQQLGTLSKSFEQAAMPLPTPPVGIGAEWRQRKTIVQNGMTMVTLTTLTVTGMEGDKVTFTSATEVTGPDQSLSQGGTAIAIKHLRGHGTGTGTIDLARMVIAGEFTAEFTSDMSSEGQDATMVMKMVTKMTPGSPAQPTPQPQPQQPPPP
jgi:hypothetical protein